MPRKVNGIGIYLVAIAEKIIDIIHSNLYLPRGVKAVRHEDIQLARDYIAEGSAREGKEIL